MRFAMGVRSMQKIRLLPGSLQTHPGRTLKDTVRATLKLTFKRFALCVHAHPEMFKPQPFGALVNIKLNIKLKESRYANACI
jgi:hypothetical protein